jgi:hypothetical protein
MDFTAYHQFGRGDLGQRRGHADFVLWTAELLLRWGVPRVGLHVIEWRHDAHCPLHPPRVVRLRPGRCTCRPDAELVLNFGTPVERRIEVVRNGIALPVRPLAEEELK